MHHDNQVLDFKSMEHVKAYYDCERSQPGLAALPPATNRAKSIFPVPSCDIAAPMAPQRNTSFMHILIYNATTKPNNRTAAQRLVDLHNSAVAPMSCAYSNLQAGVDMGWGPYLADVSCTAIFTYLIQSAHFQAVAT